MKQQGKSVVISVKMPRKLALQLEKLAASRERSMGAEVRLMIQERLDVAERNGGGK